MRNMKILILLLFPVLATATPIDFNNGTSQVQVSPANPLPVMGGGAGGILTVTQAGSTGTDYSVNPPTIPNVGANFGTTGIYANYVWVGTIAADSTRNNIEINNLSGSNLVIIRDAGSSSSGSAPVNASIIVLASGTGVGSAGGFYSSVTFKGRIQLYVPVGVTSPFISVYKD